MLPLRAAAIILVRLLYDGQRELKINSAMYGLMALSGHSRGEWLPGKRAPLQFLPSDFYRSRASLSLRRQDVTTLHARTQNAPAGSSSQRWKKKRSALPILQRANITGPVQEISHGEDLQRAVR